MKLPEFKIVKCIVGVGIWAGAEMEDIPRFEVREDDVWVCSFPRSGKILSLWCNGVICDFFFFFFFNSVLRPFQDYFSSYETDQSVGGRKRENPEKNHLAHPQAELGLSHMWPERNLRFELPRD